jgi:hypothetical protein
MFFAAQMIFGWKNLPSSSVRGRDISPPLLDVVVVEALMMQCATITHARQKPHQLDRRQKKLFHLSPETQRRCTRSCEVDP